MRELMIINPFLSSALILGSLFRYILRGGGFINQGSGLEVIKGDTGNLDPKPQTLNPKPLGY